MIRVPLPHLPSSVPSVFSCCPRIRAAQEEVNVCSTDGYSSSVLSARSAVHSSSFLPLLLLATNPRGAPRDSKTVTRTNGPKHGARPDHVRTHAAAPGPGAVLDQ